MKKIVELESKIRVREIKIKKTDGRKRRKKKKKER